MLTIFRNGFQSFQALIDRKITVRTNELDSNLHVGFLPGEIASPEEHHRKIIVGKRLRELNEQETKELDPILALRIDSKNEDEITYYQGKINEIRERYYYLKEEAKN